MEQDISNVKYVGQATATRLAEHGITTIEQLAAMDVEVLAAIPGIGATTAPLMLASAQALLPTTANEAEAEEVAPIASTDEPVLAAETVLEEADDDVSDDVFTEEESVEVSDKKAKKADKKAKKALKKAAKKAAKKAKKQAKEAKKAERKAAKKADKKAKKAVKKAAKAAKA